MDLTTPGGLLVPESLLTWRFSRSSGPGGQGVNTTDSRAEVVLDLSSPQAALHLPAEVLSRLQEKLGSTVAASSQTERSQLQNRSLALERLGRTLDAALEEAPVRKKKKTPRWVKEKRLQDKRLQSEKKAARRGAY